MLLPLLLIKKKKKKKFLFSHDVRKTYILPELQHYRLKILIYIFKVQFDPFKYFHSHTIENLVPFTRCTFGGFYALCIYPHAM